MLTLFNRTLHYNSDTGTLLFDPDRIPEDIYSPIVCINDDNNQNVPIRGSCRHYNTRKDITEQVLKLESLQCFIDNFSSPSSVVIVANQNLRAEALLGPNNAHQYLELKLETYCILEYVGRKRFYGYLNSKKEG